MTKVISVTVLHYGLDFLEYALRSVVDHVSEAWVLYTYVGSHGSRTDIPCPESRDDLYAAARRGAGDKLRWHEGEWENEGQQRDAINALVPDADTVIVVDSDEVLSDGLAAEAIAFAQTVQVRNIRLPFYHLWRTFRRGFFHDPAYPVRIINPQYPTGETTMPTDKRVWHFGYCQRSEVVFYKLATHGHRGQFRKDVDWFKDVWLANRQTDCHIVGSEYWNAEDTDLSQLPSVLNAHPYANLELIP